MTHNKHCHMTGHVTNDTSCDDTWTTSIDSGEGDSEMMSSSSSSSSKMASGGWTVWGRNEWPRGTTGFNKGTFCFMAWKIRHNYEHFYYKKLGLLTTWEGGLVSIIVFLMDPRAGLALTSATRKWGGRFTFPAIFSWLGFNGRREMKGGTHTHTIIKDSLGAC